MGLFWSNVCFLYERLLAWGTELGRSVPCYLGGALRRDFTGSNCDSRCLESRALCVTGWQRKSLVTVPDYKKRSRPLDMQKIVRLKRIQFRAVLWGVTVALSSTVVSTLAAQDDGTAGASNASPSAAQSQTSVPAKSTGVAPASATATAGDQGPAEAATAVSDKARCATAHREGAGVPFERFSAFGPLGIANLRESHLSRSGPCGLRHLVRRGGRSIAARHV